MKNALAKRQERFCVFEVGARFTRPLVLFGYAISLFPAIRGSQPILMNSALRIHGHAFYTM